MSKEILFAVSDVCSAFNERSIGSKVYKESQLRFLTELMDIVREHEKSNVETKAPGQYFIPLPSSFYGYVSAGDGKKTDNPEDYVIRKHREGPKLFLRRELAGEVTFLGVVVYTREAYIKDPDFKAEELERLGEATHVIVAVIASSGPAAPVTPYRFVHNLSGGNNAYKCPSSEYKEHIEWLESEAKKVIGYWNEYEVVAD